MLGGDWRLYGAIGGAVLLACSLLVWGYQREHAQQRHAAAEDSQHAGPKKWKTECIGKPGHLSCLAYAVEAESADKNAEYDLRAQQDMAEWAFAMFLVALAGLGATVAGLIYIVRAYRLNADATEAATKTLELQRNLERPYLFVAPPDPNEVRQISGDGFKEPDIRSFTESMSGAGGIENHGRAPAIVTCVRMRGAAARDIDEAYLRTRSQMIPRRMEWIIAPDGKSNPLGFDETFGISLDDREALRSSSAVRFIFGEVEYRDVSGARWVRRFAWCYRGQYVPMGPEGGDKYNYEEKVERAKPAHG